MAGCRLEVGQKINKLLIQEIYKKDSRSWCKCLCDCGTTKEIRRTNIISGNTKSCGCSRTLGLKVGQKINKLLIQEIYKKDSRSWCKCLCDCGTEKDIRAANVLNGTKSCGCFMEKTDSIAEINKVYQTYRSRAKKRHQEFKLDQKYFNKLIFSNCTYCGSPPSNIFKSRTNTDYDVLYNGIDRVNSKYGYVKNNCVPCCRMCNQAKSSYSMEEFLEWAKTLYQNQFGNVED